MNVLPYTLFLEIGQVTLHGDFENPVVRVTAHVNGDTYEHPSTSGANWMQVGPNMDHKIIELPSKEINRLFFSLSLMEGEEAKESADTGSLYAYTGDARYAYSQTLSYIEKIPFEGSYRVFEQIGDIRQVAPMADIQFHIFQK